MSSSDAVEAGPSRPLPARVIVQAAVFAIFVVATAIALEWSARYRVANSYTKKRALLVQRGADVEVVVMGPSSGYFGIDPAKLHANAINLADVSQSLYYDDQILRAYLPSMKKLKVVIFSLGLPSYEFGLDGSAEAYRMYWYTNFWGFPLEHDDHTPDLRKYSAFALAPPSMRMTSLLRHEDSAPTLDVNGWYHPPPTSAAVTEDQAIKLVGYQAEMMSRAKGEENERTLRHALGMLQERGIVTVLVWPPVHRWYLQHFDAAARTRAHEAFTRIAPEYHAQFRDYSTDPRFEQEDFYDTNHLNERGSEKFSAILDVDVVTPAVLH